MRDQARQLDENQEKLTEQLEAWKRQPPADSLRDSGERKQVREGLEQQEKQLDQLLEQMRTHRQDAEETEPLLAKELYDTVRKANEQKIPDALKETQQLVDAGIRRGGRQGVPARRPGHRAVARGRRAGGPERPRRRDRRPAASPERARRPRRPARSRDRPGDRARPPREPRTRRTRAGKQTQASGSPAGRTGQPARRTGPARPAGPATGPRASSQAREGQQGGQGEPGSATR